jgi:hypothetical protein
VQSMHTTKKNDRQLQPCKMLPCGCKAILLRLQIATFRTIVVPPSETAAVRQEENACPRQASQHICSHPSNHKVPHPTIPSPAASLSLQRTEKNKARECLWQARPGMRADAIWLAPDLCLATILPFSTRCVTMRHRKHVCRTCSYTFDTKHLPGRQIDRPETADSTVDDSQKQIRLEHLCLVRAS